MKNRIDDPRFHGAGLVSALVCLGCFAAGLAVGRFLTAVLA